MPNPMIDFTQTYALMAIVNERPPAPSFIRDRYFPTAAEDVFNTDKVLVEYKKNGKKMAPIVSPRAGYIPVDRDSYSIHEFTPAFIAPSRRLTIDELAKRGFGEALYANSTKAERAKRIIASDMADLEDFIVRREEWMAIQTMLNNECTMQEWIDSTTKGQKLYVKFYGESSGHTYTPQVKWDQQNSNIRGDIVAMCNMLLMRGLPAEDLILGKDAFEYLFMDQEIREEIKTYSGINAGRFDEKLVRKYPGVTYHGTINFGGHVLNLFTYIEEYEDEDTGTLAPYMPADKVIVTAPNCGRIMYGAITQIDYGSDMPTTYGFKRVPKYSVDQRADIREYRLASAPLAAPRNSCPYITATVLTPSA